VYNPPKRRRSPQVWLQWWTLWSLRQQGLRSLVKQGALGLLHKLTTGDLRLGA